MKRKYRTETSSEKSAKFSINQLLIIASVCLLLGGTLGYLVNQNLPTKIVHIRSDQVFSSFTLTQELETKLNNTRQSRKLILDNLGLRLQKVEARSSSTDSILQLQNEFLVKQEQLQKDNQEQAEEYDAQIWTQLNQYIQDFCDEKGYGYILGSTGTGNLMGAAPENDVTESVIAYVNNRYLGGLK